MKCAGAMRICLVVVCAVVVEASVLKEKKPVSFDKNLPVDTRRNAAASSDKVLKFNHPYPVVQDSEDFDKDYVKDENKDNGEWKAQSEYDRLRHKLVKLKTDAASKLAKKNAEKKDIEVVTEEAEKVHAKDELAIAEASKPIAPYVKPDGQPLKPVEPVKPTLEPKKVVVEPATTAKPEPAVKETTKAPEPEKSATTTLVPEPLSPTAAVEQEIADAKACIAKNEKELAAAKAEMKTLMEDLKKAQNAHDAAIKQVEKTGRVAKEAGSKEDISHKQYDAANKEYLAAAETYEKQLRKVESMRLKLQVASEKVKAMRDAEDKRGGVYPTDTQPKSAAKSQLVGFAMIAAAFAQMF